LLKDAENKDALPMALDDLVLKTDIINL